MKHIECILAVTVLLIVSGCSGLVTSPSSPEYKERAPVPKEFRLSMLGYAIQVGAFRNIDNAVRLSEELKTKGVNAYYFIDPTTHLYKVRFSNFQTFNAAKKQAERMMDQGTITDFYIVKPDTYAAAKMRELGMSFLREQIVQTARSFLGIPYKWGGESVDDGFDCSGLTMVSYQLNGLDLPRNSKQQYEMGRPIDREELSAGDLVFFSTNGGRGVSHVGIYVGDGIFIHAPKEGATITTAPLSSKYFGKCFVGARTYM